MKPISVKTGLRKTTKEPIKQHLRGLIPKRSLLSVLVIIKADNFRFILNNWVHIKPIRQSDTPQVSSDFNDNPLISEVLSPRVFQRLDLLIHQVPLLIL